MLSRLRGMYAFPIRDEYVPEPFTLYNCIRALPPATSRWVDTLGRKKQETFCSISEEYENPSDNTMRINPGQPRTHLRELLLDSVRHHLVADVPVGMFLSSGIDSTSLVDFIWVLDTSPPHR